MKQKVSELNTPWLLYDMSQGEEKKKAKRKNRRQVFLQILSDYIII